LVLPRFASGIAAKASMVLGIGSYFLMLYFSIEDSPIKNRATPVRSEARRSAPRVGVSDETRDIRGGIDR
jgi:hypothetical protein